MMPVIGVDSSGHVGKPPVWIIATKTTNKQEHAAMMLDEATHSKYVDCTENWAEKLSAVMIFRVVKTIIYKDDSIVIDWDFQGKKQTYVHQYLRRLFGVEYYGRYPLSNPSISFATAKNNSYVKRADLKSRLARHKKLKYDIAPDLFPDIRKLERTPIGRGP